MSYVRFGKGSDIYVFFSTSGFYECCGCRLNPKLKLELFETTRCKTATQMFYHMEKHEAMGHKVPKRAYHALVQDIENGWPAKSRRKQFDQTKKEWATLFKKLKGPPTK